MKRIFIFVYGAASYAAFLATFLYAIGFIGNLMVPKSLDSPGEGPWQTAFLIDLGLLSIFAVQHSVMARPAFKRILTSVIPVPAERSTYVLASSLALLLLFWQWRPIGGTVWDFRGGAEEVLLYSVFAFGWALILVATFVINHFDLFGLRQVWRHLLGQPQAGVKFSTPFLYRIVRHPLYVGWLLVFGVSPASPDDRAGNAPARSDPFPARTAAVRGRCGSSQKIERIERNCYESKQSFMGERQFHRNRCFYASIRRSSR
jgi:protein-S-isoprenylcysteine O-methyltransferase Ste14